MRKLSLRIAVLATVMTLVAAACAGDEGEPEATEPTASPTGGSIVIGAEQWADCLNPITACAAASWAFWSVFNNILGKATVLDIDGNWVANENSVLSEAPSIENGMISEDGLTITMPIKEEAAWNDGSPITCDDMRFTWLAQLNTSGAYSAGVGFDQIKEIDCSDPKSAVLSFSAPYAPWNELFGGALGFILKAAAYPDVDPDEPNIEEFNTDSIDYSGSQWVLDSWSKEQAVFSRNEGFWGQQPLLDQVTFIPILDQAAEVNALLAGDVSVIFPQPSDVSLLDQVAGDPAVQAVGADGVFNEGLWLNLSKPPLDDIAVREAFAYAIDRQAVIDAIIKLNNPNAVVNNCLLWIPTIGEWCDQEDFADFTYDPDRSVEILEGAGWDCSAVPDGPCEKNGEPLVLDYSTVAGNTRRETTQQLLQEKALAGGFEFAIENFDANVLFGRVGPRGQYNVNDYALGGSPDPTATANFGCDAVPTEENGFAGGNWLRWCNEKADALMRRSDQQIDPAVRLEQIRQIGDLMREDIISLPLYILPQVCAFRSDVVAGPVGDWTHHINSCFANMYEWYLAS